MLASVVGVIRPLFVTRQRREVLVALTAVYMMVQLSSLPVALALPSLAEDFDTSIDDTAWIVIVYLLMIGSLVLLMARLGDRYGHARVFYAGIVVATVGAVLLSISQDLWHLVLLRGLNGIGSAMIMGNANAILAFSFPPEERGRAFAIPIMGARFGTLTGLAVFGAFLQFFSWRLLFITFIPLGVVALIVSLPLLRHERQASEAGASGPVDWTGAALLFFAAVVFILSGSHLHPGEESYTSGDAVSYHVPMHLLFLLLLGAFIVMERRIANPVIDLGHFRERPFSLSLASNSIYHGSMLATMTLVPILVEEGFGRSPIFVTVVLFPSQALGLFLPMIAGWIYDKYRPQFLRLWCMLLIAGGFIVLSQLAPEVSFWALPLIMLPISIGTNLFNPINNATIMNSLPLEHRGVASGMLETSRELGHALGATAAAAVLGLSIPDGIERLPFEVARGFFLEGFQLSTLAVVVALLVGALLVYFQKEPAIKAQSAAAPSGDV